MDLSAPSTKDMGTLASVADAEALREELHEGVAVVPHRRHLAVSQHDNSYGSVIRFAPREIWVVERAPQDRSVHLWVPYV